MDIYDWHATAELRFVYRQEGVKAADILQQKWRRFPLNGLVEVEWRDVPLVTDERA